MQPTNWRSLPEILYFEILILVYSNYQFHVLLFVKSQFARFAWNGPTEHGKRGATLAIIRFADQRSIMNGMTVLTQKKRTVEH